MSRSLNFCKYLLTLITLLPGYLWLRYHEHDRAVGSSLRADERADDFIIEIDHRYHFALIIPLMPAHAVPPVTLVKPTVNEWLHFDYRQLIHFGLDTALKLPPEAKSTQLLQNGSLAANANYHLIYALLEARTVCVCFVGWLLLADKS
jgi:hypothetical protein